VGKLSKRNAQPIHAIEYPVNFELIYENNALGYPARNIKVNVRQDKCIGVDIKVFRLNAEDSRLKGYRLKGCRGLD
jgi:hypothetical protein